MSATGIAFGCVAAMLLWLPCFRAKDVFPFLEESLLRLEEKEPDDQRRSVVEKRGEGGWSAWSPWRQCSRSCDGGISISLRVCKGKCPDGEPIRRQICNMQPCPDASDFRASQCSGYNSQPYRDRLYVWQPYYDPEEPCALTCQAEGFHFVAKHSERVQDGTRCREGALDMCVNGQCQPIGCDLQVGSHLKVDECGICGGDGSSCQRPTFVWQEESYGACSVTCGGGIQLSESTCRNKETNEQVDPRLCNLSIRPRTKAKHCNRHPCPVVWSTGQWGPCSATCGAGVQSRPVFCVQGGPNGSRIDVKSEYCPRHKPLTERACLVEECPRWFQGPWSACSVTCGHGVQTRAVVCRDSKNQYSELCDAKDMPVPQKPCEMPDSCPQATPPNTTPAPCIYTSSGEEQTTTEEPTTSTEPTIYLTQAPPNLTSAVHYFVGPWGRCGGEGYRRRVVHCQLYIAQTVARLPDTECIDIRPIDQEPCSVSCPPPFPPREKEQPEKEDIVEATDLNFYSWNTEKFSPCSASCSGGKHTSLVRCLRLPDEVEVSPQLCDLSVKPEPLTKKCNEQPCPKIYVWNVTDFGECSKECGGGIKTRTVRCLSVTDGEEVSAVRCPGQPPKALETCNVFDCEPAWKAEAWSKCSSSCSGGFQSRKLYCERILAPLSQAVRLPEDKCHKTRPKAIKKCNLKPCPLPHTTTTTTTTTGRPSTTTVSAAVGDDDQDQSVLPDEENGSVFVQKYPDRRVNLKASGLASLIRGSNAKFHCPLPGNASRVLWFKGHLRIPPATAGGWPRVSVSGKGALRIHKITPSDAGTYTCLAGGFRSDVRVRVRPVTTTRQPAPPGYVSDAGSPAAYDSPPTPPSSEEEERQGHRKVTNRSALPQVRHSLVNMRHFSSEESDRRYQWVVGEWSECSQTCGDSGTQVRTIECRVTVLNSTKRDVPKGLCEDGGHPQPPTMRSCQLNPCPQWIAGNWSECSVKNCLSWNTAYQKRGVMCEIAHRTVTPSHCDGRGRPRRKRECYNPRCKGEWSVGPWSECTSSCGRKGFQSRRVQCLWRDSEEAAPSSACKGPAPQSTAPCGRTPCKDREEEGCYDQSTYCSVVKGTKLCEASQFRLQCCASCTDIRK